MHLFPGAQSEFTVQQQPYWQIRDALNGVEGNDAGFAATGVRVGGRVFGC